MLVRYTPLLITLIIAGLQSACGGSGGGSSAYRDGTGSSSYSVGGTVNGLSAAGLTVGAGSNTVAVPSGATSFTLPNKFASGGAYTVAVIDQPAGLTCSVVNGSGVVGSSNVTNANLSCVARTYGLGGTITGLISAGLVLANGTDTAIPAAGMSTFVFPTQLAAGVAYAVTVKTQPAGISCQVLNASGVMIAQGITNVLVVCGEWTWMNGSDTGAPAPVYGTKGLPAPANNPGARWPAVTWSDAAGNFWLMGGQSNGIKNDLWKYSSSTNDWTWIGGSQSVDTAGVYGTQGTPDAANWPGGRVRSTSWTDGNGNLWLFGGEGYDSAGVYGTLNDLWEYSPTTGQWEWVGGADTQWPNTTAPPVNVPGARVGAVSWVAAGDLWLFGGSGPIGVTNDLWKYDPTGNVWTLVNGSQASANSSGVYGTQGTPANGNVPGARAYAVAGADASGDLWLFGGSGYDSTRNSGFLNDLWMFNPTTSQWEWLTGANAIQESGVYANGTLTPGARQNAIGGADIAGNLWIFGGEAYDSTGTEGAMNDLWRFSPATGTWTWMSGSQLTNQDHAAGYGTQNVGAASNTPGQRSVSAAWLDTSGNFWLFGGSGFDSTGTNTTLNDLWKFVP